MRHFGYWVFGKDMNNVNLKTLKNNGITDIFLNYYAFTTHGESKVLTWIENAKKYSINVHIWMQCFYDGGWINPVTNSKIINTKLKEAKKYADMKNVKGVHLDYVRYPGNAYKTDKGAETITNFVKKVRSQNPNTFLSCAIMPEDDAKYYYGQDIAALGKTVDAILPMQYKGNYEAGTSWLASTTKSLSSKATVWSGLQTYKSDDDVTQLSSNELINDAKTCLSNGASGAILFRYGVSPNVNFSSLQTKTTTQTTTGDKVTQKTAVKKEVIAKIAKEVKETVAKEYKIPKKSNGIAYPEYAYLLAKAITKPNKDILRKEIGKAPKPSGTYISRTVKKSNYVKLAKNLITYVNTNKRIPNYLTYSGYKIRTKVYIDAFARIVNWYYTHNKKFPAYVNVNSAAFTKQASSSTAKDEVFDYFVKKFGNVSSIDEALEKVEDRGYGYYYDDVYSNKTSIDRMASYSGINCTDSCQVFWHIGKALGYDVECLHVLCSGGDGHVRLRLKHPTNTDGEWIYRDPAAVLSDNGAGVAYNWCTSGYSLLATNPSWFLANVNR